MTEPEAHECTINEPNQKDDEKQVKIENGDYVKVERSTKKEWYRLVISGGDRYHLVRAKEPHHRMKLQKTYGSGYTQTIEEFEDDLDYPYTVEKVAKAENVEININEVEEPE